MYTSMYIRGSMTLKFRYQKPAIAVAVKRTTVILEQWMKRKKVTSTLTLRDTHTHVRAPRRRRPPRQSASQKWTHASSVHVGCGGIEALKERLPLVPRWAVDSAGWTFSLMLVHTIFLFSILKKAEYVGLRKCIIKIQERGIFRPIAFRISYSTWISLVWSPLSDGMRWCLSTGGGGNFDTCSLFAPCGN